MTFAEIPIKSLFRFKGELMIKLSPVAFVSAESPSLGERMVEPNMGRHLETVEATPEQTAKEIRQVEFVTGTQPTLGAK
jgi:hypothetical protein